MKNTENLIALSSVLLVLQGQDLSWLSNLQGRIKKITSEKSETIDPVLELKLSLHKHFSLLILKSVKSDTIPGEKAKLASEALNELLEDETSYKRLLEEEVIIVSEATDSSSSVYLTSEFMRRLVWLLLLEAFCDDEAILDEKERNVIKLFKGLRYSESTSIEQIAEQLKMSNGQIGQVKESAETKIWKKVQDLGIVGNTFF